MFILPWRLVYSRPEVPPALSSFPSLSDCHQSWSLSFHGLYLPFFFFFNIFSLQNNQSTSHYLLLSLPFPVFFFHGNRRQVIASELFSGSGNWNTDLVKVAEASPEQLQVLSPREVWKTSLCFGELENSRSLSFRMRLDFETSKPHRQS